MANIINQNYGQIGIICPMEDRKYFNKLPEIGSMRLLFFDIIENNPHRFLVRDSKNEDIESLLDFVDSPPIDFDPLAIVYFSSDGEEIANIFKNALTNCGGAYLGVPLIRLSNNSELEPLIGRMLLERLQQTQLRNTQISLQLATLRRDYEKQMDNFTRLEEFIAKRGIKLLDLEFSYANDLAKEAINWDLWRQADGTFDLRQRLALSSRGLAIIGLPVHQTDWGNEPIIFELWTLENQHQLYYWTVTPQQIQSDWVHLVLPKGLDGIPLTSELRIKCSRWGAPSILQLGKPHPLPDFCLRTGDGRALSAPLAVKLWKTVSGMSVPKFVGNTVNVGGLLPNRQEATVSLERMRHIRSFSQLPENLSFYPIAFWEEHSAILVHPVEGQSLIAYLPAAIQESVTKISIAIELANEKAQPMEFAAAWLEPSENPEQVFQSEDFDPEMRFSGWIKISALERAWINILIPKAGGTKGDLYFASRPAPGMAGYNCWLFIRRIDYLTAND